VVLGLTFAIGAAVCYGVATILQAAAVGDAETVEGLGVASLARSVSGTRYVAGLALDLVGFVAAVAALRTLPLFVVQAAVASSVGVTALGARVVFGTRLSARERTALISLVVGLVLLGMAGRPEHATRLHEPGPMILLAAAAIIAIGSAAVARARGPRVGVVLAAGAGAAFGGVGIASRALVVPHHYVHLLRDPIAYAVVAHGAIAILLFAAALQRNHVTKVAAVTFAVETVVPAAIGLAFLGDHARRGFIGVAAIGFVVTVVASIALARHADPEAAFSS
jgi:drug/metabolite transporter (DMT)-like permease